MELFPPLSGFYQAIADDARIGSTHISIYMALLQQWNINGGKNPVEIERILIMKAAKINARHTYNKCINELHEFGYILYEPAPNGSINSRIFLNKCEM
ncbi:hypothetical protein [Flavihumibacter sp. ZG627]|uniref:hypothetical protein n=1 Tax=Flavihumibacter sp. ZG627 TaxID=1463156 RepID=UPI00057EA21F|nr:hypothetical protein [Flavihumibacter sp. ZG627]KIC89815.1 hypothetical protein HY58_14160 [Flavihumibacter sp. ZG627]